MTWVNALKEYAKVSGKYFVPKKGTPEYDAVKKIQDKMAGVVEEKVVEKKKFAKKEEPIIEAPAKAPIKKLTKEEHIEEYVKPRVERLKKLKAEKDEADKKTKETQEKYDAIEKATKAKKNAMRPVEELVAEKELLKAKVSKRAEKAIALKAEIEAKKLPKAPRAKKVVAEVAEAPVEAPAPKVRKPRVKKVVAEVAVEASPAPKGRKPRAKKASMTIEEKPVLLEFN